MQKNEESTSEEENTKIPSTPQRDPELLYEERLAKLLAENDDHRREKKDLQKDLGDLHDRLARMQENNVRGSHPRQLLIDTWS